jgi:hypothetical protein
MKKILVADPEIPHRGRKQLSAPVGCEIVHRGDERQSACLHQAEKVNLIISPLVASMSTDRLFSAIRSDRHLRSVSLIMSAPIQPRIRNAPISAARMLF